MDFNEGKIVPIDLEEEMRKSYLNFAMYVIVDRALPDVRDGLKPVQRRILYTMLEIGLRPDRPFKKSARVVGETMAKYHPHGDSAIYDAMVRMGQDFSYRYLLVQGQGNFGCFTGDTKIKMADGTEKSFAELAELGPEGRFLVYAMDRRNGKIVVAEGRNARVTRKKARLVELTLDSGETIRATPDHRFLLRSGQYKEAQYLTPDDSLAAGYFSTAPSSEGSHESVRIRQPNGEWEPVHQLVDEYYERTGQVPEGFVFDSAALVDPVEAYAEEAHNHRVVSVRWLEETEDVYDITVDHYHNFLLASGVFVHNSIDGDPPAAMRYTEARLTRLAMEMLRDIDKDTVDYGPNFDDSLEQPESLPARFPNLLVNGATGIAVGMSTNIPPHNLGEVISAIVHMIDHPDAEVADLMKFIKGPDFPTGGVILGREGIRQAYQTGRGRIRVRAKAQIEQMEGGKHRILVTEIPYMVNKSNLVEKIAQLHHEKKVDGITALRDESDRSGMRIVIELRKDANPNVVLNQLYKYSQLQETFGAIMLALVNGEPKVLNLQQMLQHYLDYQREIVVRRTRFDLKKAEDRAHILEGYRIALDHIDEIIQLIRGAASDQDAKEKLMTRFGLSERQAVAILDMQLRRLTGLEREKIENEYAELLKTIDYLRSILEDDNKRDAIIKEELLEIKEKFADPRRSEITLAGDDGDFDIEDLIADEDIVVTVTHHGYIKRLPVTTYRSQRRGGRGIAALSTRTDDFVEQLFITSTHSYVIFFTNKGRVFRLKGHEIPEASRNARGTAIVNLIQIEPGEFVQAAIPIREYSEDSYLFMATRNGVVKKTALTEFDSPYAGLIAINLDENDEVIGVQCTDGEQDILLVTREGQAIRFPEKDVRAMGRAARGVKGITLDEGDQVVGMDEVVPGGDLLVVTELGYGKRTALDEYRVTGRGGKGIRTIQRSSRIGPIAGVKVVRDQNEIMLISHEGIMIRFSIDDVPRLGRSTQGVRLMRLGENDYVVALAHIATKEEDEDGETPANDVDQLALDE